MPKTDMKLWDHIALVETPKWEKRAHIISHFIRPSDVVLDLGAADRKLQKYIPDSCGYIPVDCTASLPGTFVVDYNQEFKLPDTLFTVIVSAGFLEYIEDLDSFMEKLVDACDGMYLLFTYSYSGASHNAKEFKKLNAFTDAGSVLGYFERYTRNLQEVLTLKNQSLFVCTLSKEGISGTPDKRTVPITINEALKRPNFLQKLVAKLTAS